MDKPLQVLVVEDSEDDTLLLIRELKRNGYTPSYERVETAEAMKSALAQQSWDIVVTDYTMPQFNSLAALSVLKEAGFDIPFIIISGTIGEERAIAAMKAGAHDYLKKGHLGRLTPIIERELREVEMRRERRRAEKALRDRERYFRALIENNSDIIMTLDAAGYITYASPALVRVVGYTLDTYIGRTLLELIHPDDVQANTTLLAQLVQQPGSEFASQFRLQHQDGSWHWVEAIATNMLAEPGIHAIISNLRDVTERKNLQAQILQIQKMEAIGKLTAGIAHDFNNMLTVINSYAELLQMQLPESDPLRHMADRILEGGENAANMVRQLLVFSRKQTISPQVLGLNDIVIKLEKMLDRVIGDHIKMSTVLDPDLKPIKADSTQVEQVIINLAVNARDAMPSGGNLVIETANIFLDDDFASTHIDMQPGSYCMLAISDTGTGMTDEVKSHIFEPFFTTKGEGKGTGLGLATVYGIVKQSKGNILVYSEVNQGTRIEIYFPSVEETEKPAPQRENVVKQLTGGEVILLAEDNDGVRVLTKEILEELGYTVLVAEDGQVALELVAQHEGHIDLLLTDVVMPGINGRELAAHLLQSRPTLKVLLMSGYSREKIGDQGFTAPLLQKPYTPQELAQWVRKILDES
ncbi:MAG: response regulator [Candidatus Promineifilaceae bacterium]